MEGTLGPGSWGLELEIWVSKEQDWVSGQIAGQRTFWREKQPPAAFLNIRRNRSMSHMKGPQQPPGPKPPLTHKETHLQKVGCFFSKSEYQLGLLAGFWTHGPELFALEHVNQLLHMKLGVKAILPKNKFKFYFWNSIGSGQGKKNQPKNCDTCRQLHGLRKAETVQAICLSNRELISHPGAYFNSHNSPLSR